MNIKIFLGHVEVIKNPECLYNRDYKSSSNINILWISINSPVDKYLSVCG